MTFKSYLWGMRISLILSFAAWALVVFYVDPEKSGLAGMLFFYATTFLFLSSLLSLFFAWTRGMGKDNDGVVGYLGMVFRQSVLLSFLVIALLIFQQFRVLTWWDGALTVAGIFLVELYFLTRK